MKKVVLSAIAASLVATPALAAPPRYDHRAEQTVVVRQPARTVVIKKEVRRAPPRFAYRQWRKGQRFDHRYAQNYRVIDNYRAYHLRTPPRGYRYVRSGNDAVLIGITTGLIAGVIAGAIH